MGKFLFPEQISVLYAPGTLGQILFQVVYV